MEDGDARQLPFDDATFDVVVSLNVLHNIAKRERYQVDGAKREVLVHRKGATRAFPAGHRRTVASTGPPAFLSHRALLI